MEPLGNPRLSTTTKRVLHVLLATDRSYGLEICQEVGLAIGAAYPILAHLERARWVASGWEDIDAQSAGRPARRYYRLRPEGVLAATQALAKLPAPRPLKKAVTRMVAS